MNEIIQLLLRGDIAGLAARGIVISESQVADFQKGWKSVLSGVSKNKVLASAPMVALLNGPLKGFTNSILGAFNGVTNTIASGIQNIGGGFEGNIKESLISIENTLSSGIRSLASLNPFQIVQETLAGGIGLITDAIGNAYGAETQARRTINRELNVTGELAAAYRDTLVDAYVQVKLFGGEFKDVQEIVEGTAKALGTVKMLHSGTLDDIYVAQKALGVNNNTIADAAAAFEDVSIGISSVSKQLTVSGTMARNVGLKVNDFITKLTQNLTVLNSYGFKNGVDGLNKMLQKAQSLRLEMSTITGMADKVFNPEGAIEMAANLQAIGAGFGSLADPMKLVYQATNDMNGLQDSLVEAAKSLATFNAQSGRFEINAVNMRKARDMAEALGMNYQELANLAVRAQQKSLALSQVNLLGNTFTDEQKEFLANMAEMGKNGKMVISLPDNLKDKFGEAAKNGMLDVSQMTGAQVDRLKEELDKYNRQVNQDPRVIATQQLSELEGIKNIAQQMLTKMGVTALRSDTVQGFKERGRQIADNPVGYAQMGDDFAHGIEGSLKGIFDSPVDSMKEIAGALKDLVDKIWNGNLANPVLLNEKPLKTPDPKVVGQPQTAPNSVQGTPQQQASIETPLHLPDSIKVNVTVPQENKPLEAVPQKPQDNRLHLPDGIKVNVTVPKENKPVSAAPQQLNETPLKVPEYLFPKPPAPVATADQPISAAPQQLNEKPPTIPQAKVVVNIPKEVKPLQAQAQQMNEKPLELPTHLKTNPVHDAPRSRPGEASASAQTQNKEYDPYERVRKVEVDVNINTPTMLDDLQRKLLRDPAFIAEMKRLFGELEYGTK